MSDHDKMMAFGHWLTERRAQLQAELAMTCVNKLQPEAAIRVKAGHLESTVFILDAFRELYEGDLTKFMEERLGQKPEAEEEKESTQDESA